MGVRKTVGVLGLAILIGAITSHAQGPATSTGSSSSNTSNRSVSPRTMRRPLDLQGPLYISGRVVAENGKPLQESLGVELACESRLVQAIRSGLGGYFTFSLGTNLGGGNLDFSASNETAMGGARGPGEVQRSYSGTMGSCEVRVSVPGYYPISQPILEQPTTGRLELGTLRLRRIAGVQGTYVSLTSLMVPNKARDEYEKALKDLEKNRADSAQQHLQKAVALYDGYAAAWNELGQLYVAGGKKEEAAEAFEKAIVADSEYLQPYLSLASLQLQNQQWQETVDTAKRILELDSNLGIASFLLALGNFNLHHLEAAEKNALEAEKKPHERTPQVHMLLAEIFFQKRDYDGVATHLRSYLEEDPDGPFAEQARKGLEDLKQSADNSSAPPAAIPAAQP
ncbi:MAG: tetratricopeptide repeat protein [Acidobacteria bacterium]|nr:tetratricopeptide repeat protein [Acidobacteriota bacterium]